MPIGVPYKNASLLPNFYSPKNCDPEDISILLRTCHACAMHYDVSMSYMACDAIENAVND